MKKFLFTTAAFLLLATAALQAQKSYVAYSPKSFDNFAKTTSTPSASMSLLEKNNAKAYNHFTTTYGSDVDADVIIDASSTMVVFTDASILTRVYYKPTGAYAGTIRYYNASALPADVASAIRSEFRAYNIIGVTEVSTANAIVYNVKIENDKNWKTVQVAEGETSVTESYKKGK